MLKVLLSALVAGMLAWTGPLGPGPAPAVTPVSAPRPVSGTYSAGALPPEGALPELSTELVVAGLDRPTSIADVGDGRMFVTEKGGLVRVVLDGVLQPDPLLDLREGVLSRGAERGLLAIALHPRFSDNARFFVHLTDRDGNSRLIEYRMSEDDPLLADPSSARLILEVGQPGEFHNGGMVQFGPEGYLYVGLGDGTFSKTVNPNAALLENPLGSILRIDVDGGDPYAVPADNPYVGTRFSPEIWISGMRNPWRFYIDAVDRLMVVGDVGQFRWEEITVVPLDAGGLDLGWPVVEGRECYLADECSRDGLTMPDVVYSHSVGCAVIAGPVYRGSGIPGLQGSVVYSDFCTGSVSAFRLFDGHVLEVARVIEPGVLGPVLSLGVDADAEILVLTEMGEVLRLVPAA